MQTAYATKQHFGSQRASMGREVLIKDDVIGLQTARIRAIDEATDRPVIRCHGAQCDMPPMPFHLTRTEADLERMPSGSWTWPPILPRLDPVTQPLRQGHDIAGNPNGRFA